MTEKGKIFIARHPSLALFIFLYSQKRSQVKKLLALSPILFPPSIPTPEKYPPERLFLLIFNFFDYNEAKEEGIDYFFQHIYQKSDRPVIVVENRLLVTEIKDEPTKIVA